MTRVFKYSKTLNLNLNMHLIHRRFSSLCDLNSSAISSSLLEINLHQLGSHLHFF
ncbi:hypothetical protein HanIR_Chr14g0697041 [Helianthus annuus]|nr:hypothetical protein HanIR_Chr14g0697041 [Helianthus annuus]